MINTNPAILHKPVKIFKIYEIRKKGGFFIITDAYFNFIDISFFRFIVLL